MSNLPTSGQVKNEGNNFNGPTSFMITAMFFVMVFTVARYNPFELAVQVVKNKLAVEAKLEVCNRIHAQTTQYGNLIALTYKSGCLATTRDYLLAITEHKNPKRHEEIKADFEAQQGNEWNRALDLCSSYTSEWELKSGVKGGMIEDMKDAFKCKETWDEAKSLGLIEE